MWTMARSGRRTRWLLAGLAALAMTLTACASVTTGSGRVGSPVTPGPGSSGSAASTPDFPSSSATPPPPSSAGSTPAPPSSASAPPPVSVREETLVTAAGGQSVANLVAVPGGYEGASWDQLGHIRFWFDPYASLRWQQIGASAYPYSAQVGRPEAAGHGARLRYMRHATFIVTGVFTGDGSGNAVAFTTGARGWGVIKAMPNGHIGPSGQPVGSDMIGLSFGFAFSDGYLITADCPQDRPQYQCDKHQIRKRWAWGGQDFHQV